MKKLRILLYVLQLEEYDIERFKKWLNVHKCDVVVEQKRKLVWTNKSKVIYLLSLPFCAITTADKALILSTSAVKPFENFFKNLVIWFAILKLRRMNNLIVIGITGSYGKTSVKEILFHLLSSKFITLKTPESYNTILGVSKVVLKNLHADHQFFVVEMGMYGRGEIKRLCDTVNPQAGIVTSVGLSHLERVGSTENIFKAKSELILSLPKGGFAVFNCENELCEKMSKIRSDLDICMAGLNKFNNNSVWASDVKTTKNGVSLTLHAGRGEVKVICPILGRQNALNIVLASSVALHYGLSLTEIKIALASLPSIPHRLQLMEGLNHSIIIDDSYNANPESVKAALEVLKEFDSPTKIVVTPGMIELGDKQYDENKKYGKSLGKVASHTLIVGETNKKALVEGLREVKANYLEVKDLKDATSRLSQIVVPDSVILFENDLTDQYL